MKQRVIRIVMFTLTVFMVLSAQTYQAQAQAPITGTPLEVTSSLTKAVPFTATVGVDQFASYRMNLAGDFVGIQAEKPISGTYTGFFDATSSPEAQHVQVHVDGSAFETIAPLGVVEAFKVNDSYYVQHPQSGAWVTVPGFLVGMMAPDGVPDVADSIKLPLTAVAQPGTEIVNGIVTRRYTFAWDNMAADVKAKADDVEGTIWVAVEGNYVVRYEATVTGQLDIATANTGPMENLLGLDLTLPDEGTMTMSYELSDINSPMTIELPQGVGGFNLFGWF